jgi:hypothetical protein
MGPESSYEMSSTTSVKINTSPKLKDDGTNWTAYKERTFNVATHKGLKRHLMGTAPKPKVPLEYDDNWYLPGKDDALDEDELEDALDKLDQWETKQASVRQIIYETVSSSIFLEVKGEPTAAAVWKKLCAIFEKKGDLVQADLEAKLQRMYLQDDQDARKHLTDMTDLRERLAEMGRKIDDPTFTTLIRNSAHHSPRSARHRRLLESRSVARS